MATRIVYLLVKQGEGREAKTYWNRAGVSFDNRDGSINVKLDVFPDLTWQIRDMPERVEENSPPKDNRKR